MRIRGTFLASRAARRIFWTLLIASAAPITLFGVAAYALLSEHVQAQGHRQQVQVTKLAGMGLLDRLLVARTALEIAGRVGRTETQAMVGRSRGQVLVRRARLDAQGNLLDGDTALAREWRAPVKAWAASGAKAGATLWLGRREGGADVPIVMALRPNHPAGDVAIGEVDPAFLFSELDQDSNGARVCVFSAATPLFCPGAAAGRADAAPAPAAADPSRRTRWSLFLRPDFGVDDWTLVSTESLADATVGAMPLTRLTALGAAATLLIAIMLGLIQVRRTMVPLEQLIAGTRRLSEHDYAARVALAPEGEFGELARSFNRMAERIGRQVQALQVQSAIDREILDGLNVARVLQRVAQRLEQLVPGGVAAVVELDRAAPALAYVHAARGPVAVVSMPRTDALGMLQLPDDELTPCSHTPAWLSQALQRPEGQVWARCAKAGDHALALLVIGTDDAAAVTEAGREIGELCDRVSVMLTSADRERRLLERATQDSLTGLSNRAGLYDFIRARLGGATPAPFTVMFIDLDRFKEVNDAMGHQAGDELLRAVAGRLQRNAPPGTLVARPGGDEFVLVLPGPRAAADATAPILCADLAQPVPLAGRVVAVGASIGMAHHPEHGVDLSDLMRRADMAMYSAKSHGGGVAAWFDAALDLRVAERAALLSDLRQALARRQFELHYQPRIEARGGAVLGAEALLRWKHPGRGLIPPGSFIELLEETGLIDEVGKWVLETAIRHLAHWRAQGVAIESVAVNVSTRQLRASGFADHIWATLARHGLRPANLEIEVTESIFIGDSAGAIRTLHTLRDGGIRIALDDFGTGYSSLSYLHTLPIGVLKVDRSFVVGLGHRDSALALTRSIVALARALGMRVVAEGVETQDQAEILVALGCDELQGYLFSPPLDGTALAALAGTWHANAGVAAVVT